ncbi:hypothetical protein LguiB_026958 [Lonicera macranthoides]
MNSGRIRWSRQLRGYGVFYFACLDPNNMDCPAGPNLDADFGEMLTLVRIISYGRSCDLAVAVQNSDFVWALDRDNDDIVWLIVRGYGHLTRRKEGRRDMGCSLRWEKGLHKHTNTEFASPQLASSSKTTANPSEDTSQGPVSVINVVLFVGSVASNRPLYTMDTINNGAILWMNNSGAIIYVGLVAVRHDDLRPTRPPEPSSRQQPEQILSRIAGLQPSGGVRILTQKKRLHWYATTTAA